MKLLFVRQGPPSFSGYLEFGSWYRVHGGGILLFNGFLFFNIMSRARLIFASTSPDSSYYNADFLWKIRMHLYDPHFFIDFPMTPGAAF